MARAKSSEPSRSRSKAASIEEASRGIKQFQEFLDQVEDLGREGFPYLDAARARTELQLRECIRKNFGERSPEFQANKHHKLLVGSPEETHRSIVLIKSLIATLEDKKLDLQGLKPQTPSTPAASPTPSARPQMTLVPPSAPKAQVTFTPATPVMPPPVTMSVPLTTNLDMATSTTGSRAPQTPTTPAFLPQAPEPTPPAQLQPTMQAVPPPTQPSLKPPVVSNLASTPVTQPTASHVSSPGPSEARHQAPQDPQPATATQHGPSQTVFPPFPLPPLPSTVLPASLVPPPIQRPDSTQQLLEFVKRLCHRFHAVARQLRLRGEYRSTLAVEDEFDVQDLLYALLRIQFDDIGTDEWTPSYTEGSPRTTFLLDQNRLAIVVKKTRPGLSAKDLADQFRVDADRYRTKHDCGTLICFVYDPEGRVGNPRGLETNHSTTSAHFTIEVLVTPK